MLAKLTAKNQVTVRKSVIAAVGHADHFEIEAKDGRIVLTF
jgi:hypothetical protein